jgi:hypothetical protein
MLQRPNWLDKNGFKGILNVLYAERGAMELIEGVKVK